MEPFDDEVVNRNALGMRLPVRRFYHQRTRRGGGRLDRPELPSTAALRPGAGDDAGSDAQLAQRHPAAPLHVDRVVRRPRDRLHDLPALRVGKLRTHQRVADRLRDALHALRLDLPARRVAGEQRVARLHRLDRDDLTVA